MYKVVYFRIYQCTKWLITTSRRTLVTVICLAYVVIFNIEINSTSTENLNIKININPINAGRLYQTKKRYSL